MVTALRPQMASCHILDASWAVLGRVLGRLGGLLGRLKVVLESPWGRLESFVGASWGRLGGLLGRLEAKKVANMAPTWLHLGYKNLPKSRLGGVLGRLGGLLGRLGAVLGDLGLSWSALGPS